MGITPHDLYAVKVGLVSIFSRRIQVLEGSKLAEAIDCRLSAWKTLKRHIDTARWRWATT
ncbi:hypothetical protein CKY39_07785 [Variovorax boronicumulans]|uniref:Uncharacterized protein n=1 Tax=Variovorax boronicumulans TaxID=436515 RepID=A0A250DFU8_9BURK|nr:hypothetical protein CKY39_07785 [Variovorax boronicumulans]